MQEQSAFNPRPLPHRLIGLLRRMREEHVLPTLCNGPNVFFKMEFLYRDALEAKGVKCPPLPTFVILKASKEEVCHYLSQMFPVTQARFDSAVDTVQKIKQTEDAEEEMADITDDMLETLRLQSHVIRSAVAKQLNAAGGLVYEMLHSGLTDFRDPPQVGFLESAIDTLFWLVLSRASSDVCEANEKAKDHEIN